MFFIILLYLNTVFASPKLARYGSIESMKSNHSAEDSSKVSKLDSKGTVEDQSAQSYTERRPIQFSRRLTGDFSVGNDHDIVLEYDDNFDIAHFKSEVYQLIKDVSHNEKERVDELFRLISDMQTKTYDVLHTEKERVDILFRSIEDMQSKTDDILHTEKERVDILFRSIEDMQNKTNFLQQSYECLTSAIVNIESRLSEMLENNSSQMAILLEVIGKTKSSFSYLINSLQEKGCDIPHLVEIEVDLQSQDEFRQSIEERIRIMLVDIQSRYFDQSQQLQKIPHLEKELFDLQYKFSCSQQENQELRENLERLSQNREKDRESLERLIEDRENYQKKIEKLESSIETTNKNMHQMQKVMSEFLQLSADSSNLSHSEISARNDALSQGEKMHFKDSKPESSFTDLSFEVDKAKSKFAISLEEHLKQRKSHRSVHVNTSLPYHEVNFRAKEIAEEKQEMNSKDSDSGVISESPIDSLLS